MSTTDLHPTAPAETVDEILTPVETAEYLRISIRTLDKWRHKKTGPAYFRMGRHVRYRRSAINAFLEQLEHTSH